MMQFSKPAIDVSQQIHLLKHRGLRINDEERGARFLEVVSFSVSPPTCDHFTEVPPSPDME